jgi:hypothetical protein
MNTSFQGWESSQLLVIEGNDEVTKSVFIKAEFPYAIYMEFEWGREEAPRWGVVDRNSRNIVRTNCENFSAAQREIASLMESRGVISNVATADDLLDELSERLASFKPLPDRHMVLVDQLKRNLALSITDFEGV